jgi:hypothetical protein
MLLDEDDSDSAGEEHDHEPAHPHARGRFHNLVLLLARASQMRRTAPRTVRTIPTVTHVPDVKIQRAIPARRMRIARGRLMSRSGGLDGLLLLQPAGVFVGDTEDETAGEDTSSGDTNPFRTGHS